MIVALHGFTGTPEGWARTQRAASRPFTTPALLGHGAAAPTVRHFDEEVDRLARAIRQPVHLLGYSLGARIALGLALRHPDHVHALTLVSVNPGLEDPATARARRAADERLARLLETEGIDAFVDHWERLPLFESQQRLPEALRAEHRRRRRAHTAAGLARSLRVLGLGSMPSRWATLASLAMRVTLVAGEHDAKFRALAERAEASIPRCEVAVVPGAGHDVPLEAPEALAAILDRAESEREAAWA